MEAKQWIDLNGRNILIVYRKGPYKEDTIEWSEGERYIKLQVKQYVEKNGSFDLLWDLSETERHCPFDLWMGIFPNSTTITDLDSNGISETAIVIKSACRSDVSSSKMKVALIENGKKLQLTGLMISPVDTNLIVISEKFEPNLQKNDTTNLNWRDKMLVLSGRYENEDDFKDEPKIFLTYAKKLWLKYITKDKFEQL